MLQTQILKGALVGIAALEAVQALSTSNDDMAQFPEFESAMRSGEYAQWKSYPVQTPSGYNVSLFRLIGDSQGAPFAATKGSLLLSHGLFSDSRDFISAGEGAPSVAVLYAKAGHDVWIASHRGRQGSRTHATLDADDPLTATQYWDYSFDDIGMDELPAMIDKVMENQATCQKVSLVPHGTGVNAALIAASRVPTFSEKVSQITALAPCIELDVQKLWLPFGDPQSMTFLYNYLDQWNLNNVFGPNFLQQIAAMCQDEPVGVGLCNNYFTPVPSTSDRWLREESLKAYQHVQQNSVLDQFQEYLPNFSETTDTPDYDLSYIDIPVRAYFGTADDRCPSNLNMPYISTIPGASIEEVFGVAHEDFCVLNNYEFVDLLESAMPQVPTAANPIYCPLRDCKKSDPDCPIANGSEEKRRAALELLKEQALSYNLEAEYVAEGSDKELISLYENIVKSTMEMNAKGFTASYDEVLAYEPFMTLLAEQQQRNDSWLKYQVELNAKLDECLADIEMFNATGAGYPEKLEQELDYVLTKMDMKGIPHDAKAELEGVFAMSELVLNQTLEQCLDNIALWTQSGEGRPFEIMETLDACLTEMDALNIEHMERSEIPGLSEMLTLMDEYCVDGNDSCKDYAYFMKNSVELNTKLDEVIAVMNVFVESGQANPAECEKKLAEVLAKMDQEGVPYDISENADILNFRAVVEEQCANDSCKEYTEFLKKSAELNAKLDEIVAEMNIFVESGQANPAECEKKLAEVLAYMDKEGVPYDISENLEILNFRAVVAENCANDSCKEYTEFLKKSAELNAKLDECIDNMNLFVEQGQSSPAECEKKLAEVLAQMDKEGVIYDITENADILGFRSIVEENCADLECKEYTELLKKSYELNGKLDECLALLQQLINDPDNAKSPEEILKKINEVFKKMDEEGVPRVAIEELEGYDSLMAALGA